MIDSFPLDTVRHLRRYRQILSVFLKHGFGFTLDYLRLRRPFLRLTLRRPTEIRAFETVATHFRLAPRGLGPTFVKLGKILSAHPGLLPPTNITELSKPQDSVPPAVRGEVLLLLEEDLGCDIEQSFVGAGIATILFVATG